MKIVTISNRSPFKIKCDEEDIKRILRFNSWRIDTSRGNRLVVKGRIGFEKEDITLGRFILNYNGPLEVDHKDRDVYNFCKDNLRLATRSQQMANTSPRGLAIYKGVTKRGKRFQARIMINYQSDHLGYFVTEQEAAKAYDKRAKEVFGEFAYLNFPCPS